MSKLYLNKAKEPKSLARYLAEYLDHEHDFGKGDAACFIDSYPDGSVTLDVSNLEITLEQALDAYKSTENVKIKEPEKKENDSNEEKIAKIGEKTTD